MACTKRPIILGLNHQKCHRTKFLNSENGEAGHFSDPVMLLLLSGQAHNWVVSLTAEPWSRVQCSGCALFKLWSVDTYWVLCIFMWILSGIVCSCPTHVFFIFFCYFFLLGDETAVKYAMTDKKCAISNQVNLSLSQLFADNIFF